MSHHESTAKGPDGRMVDRMLFFSDAVFAIVLTIMVLELHAPVMEGFSGTLKTSPAALWEELSKLIHVMFALVLSFILVGMWWTVHMRVTRNLHQFDWPVAILNLLFLFSVMMTPFAASVLGENVMNPAAWQVYWGVNAASSLSLTLLMIVISRGGGYLIGGMAVRERAARILQSIGPGIGFGIGSCLAGAGYLDLSRWCWVVIFPVMMLARAIHHTHKKSAPAPSGTV